MLKSGQKKGDMRDVPSSIHSTWDAKELAPFKGPIQPADGRVLSQRAASPKAHVGEALYPSIGCCQDSYLNRLCGAVQRGDSPHMRYA